LIAMRRSATNPMIEQIAKAPGYQNHTVPSLL
jgi:hypothetical protein